MDKMLIAHIQSGSPDPPFSREQLIPFVQDLEAFLRSHDIHPDWSVRDHQPMHLEILAALHQIMRDPDVTLFPSLLEGVRTGFGPPIPASGIFPTKPQEPLPSTPLSVHLSNWHSAEQDLPLTRELVADEVSKGFVFKYPGTLEQAQQDFPLGVSIGKLGIATSDSRPPRLVVDSSICGLNGRCVIPEKSTLPTAKELIRSFPLRGSNQLMSGFSLDVKSAHKRIVLHPDERGLVGFTLDNDIYFYYVTPFGATFSASWWSRVGGWLLRTFHGLIWFSHCGMLYVDDFIFFMDATMMPLMATMLSVFCQITQVPISWKKSELGARIQWIGWLINFRAGTISIPPQKIDKLLTYLKEMLRSSKTTRKSLEKLIGYAAADACASGNSTQLGTVATFELGAVCKRLCIAMGAAYCCEPPDLQNEANLLVESAGFGSKAGRPNYSNVHQFRCLFTCRRSMWRSFFIVLAPLVLAVRDGHQNKEESQLLDMDSERGTSMKMIVEIKYAASCAMFGSPDRVLTVIIRDTNVPSHFYQKIEKNFTTSSYAKVQLVDATLQDVPDSAKLMATVDVKQQSRFKLMGWHECGTKSGNINFIGGSKVHVLPFKREKSKFFYQHVELIFEKQQAKASSLLKVDSVYDALDMSDTDEKDLSEMTLSDLSKTSEDDLIDVIAENKNAAAKCDDCIFRLGLGFEGLLAWHLNDVISALCSMDDCSEDCKGEWEGVTIGCSKDPTFYYNMKKGIVTHYVAPYLKLQKEKRMAEKAANSQEVMLAKQAEEESSRATKEEDDHPNAEDPSVKAMKECQSGEKGGSWMKSQLDSIVPKKGKRKNRKKEMLKWLDAYCKKQKTSDKSFGCVGLWTKITGEVQEGSGSCNFDLWMKKRASDDWSTDCPWNRWRICEDGNQTCSGTKLTWATCYAKMLK
eukprot:s1556_g9.t2